MLSLFLSPPRNPAPRTRARSQVHSCGQVLSSSQMELHALAVVVAVLSTGMAAVEEEEEKEEEEERRSRQQRKRTCSWTLCRCNRAPRGWRLFQVVFPWLTALVICVPCLGVAGHGMFTMDGGTLQSSLHFLADSLLVRDQEARPVSCHPVITDHKDAATESSGSFDKEKPSEVGKVEFLGSSERAMVLDLLAEEQLVLASCILPGWSYVQQALLNTTPHAETSVQIIIQASPVQEQGAAASLDWGSNILTSVSLKFLTLVNKQSSKELKVFRIFTTNTQFCTVDFQEAVVSPGSTLSIPIAYFVNLIGKAEGRLLLQTNVGRFTVETFGEGIPFLYPLVGIMGASKSELLETVFFFNSFNESIIVDEAYVWVESTSEGSTSYQAKSRGVLCRRYETEPESSILGRLKVRPKVEWLLPPHSSSPIMDLSIMVDDGGHLVGTLFLKIFRQSVQLFEVLVVRMEIKWDSLGTSNAKLLPMENLVGVAAVFLETEKQSGWAMFLANSNLLPVQVKNASTKGQSHNRLITISVENLLLGIQVKSLVSDMSWICFRGKSSLINSTTCLAAQDLCSALLFYGATTRADVVADMCSKIFSKCTGSVFCQKYFSMLSTPCNADAVVDGLLNRKNAHGPKFIHVHDLDGRHMSWEYHTADLDELAEHGNTRGNDFKLLKKLSSEGFVKLSPFFHNPKSVCAWPRIVIESNTFVARILDWSVSMISRTWSGSNWRFCMGTIEQHDHPLNMDSNILYTMQQSNLKESQKFGCIATYGMGPVDLANSGSEYSRLFCCKKLWKFTDLLKSDFLEKSVAEDCFEACYMPMKSILAVFFPDICRVPLPLARNQQVVLKLSLLLLFSVFVIFIKGLRRERQLASDFKLRHSCSHTFHFQSVCMKTSYIKASESSTNFEHAVERINKACSLESKNDQCYENRLLAVTARVVGSLGSLFRSIFDSQATVLNVRVQFSESPQVVPVNQDPNHSKNSLMADQKTCNMEPRSVEKPGSHQTSTTVQKIQGKNCRECTDTLRVTHLEAGTSPSVSLSETLLSITEDVPLIRPVGDSEKVQHKEKKEKGKRRKRRSNIIDLKQELERTGQSCSPSPPSSPASPATPLAYSPISPFLQSDPPVRSLKGSTHSSHRSSNSCRDPTPRGTLIQFSSEMLSQLDIRAEHTYNSASKGRLHDMYTHGSKSSLEPLPTRMAVSARTGSRKDASAGENWAAVARRAIVNPSEEDQCQRLSRSSRCLKNGGTRNKPVLLPSATFPQSGRSMQWNPQKLDERSFTLNDPTSSPSLISTSLVAPNARAPGSRPHENEKLTVNNLPEVGSTVMSTDLRMHEGPNSDTFLYDIWGDHFGEINRRTQADLFSTNTIREQDMVEITSPAFPKVGSLFAASDLMTSGLTPGSADSAVGHSIFIPPAGFSVFSCDSFFSPYHCKDAAGSPTP